jgi:hypothetical protein
MRTVFEHRTLLMRVLHITSVIYCHYVICLVLFGGVVFSGALVVSSLAVVWLAPRGNYCVYQDILAAVM